MVTERRELQGERLSRISSPKRQVQTRVRKQPFVALALHMDLEITRQNDPELDALLAPELDHRRETVRLSRRQVCGLARIGFDIEELELGLVEGRLQIHELPPSLTHKSMTGVVERGHVGRIVDRRRSTRQKWEHGLPKHRLDSAHPALAWLLR